MNTTDPAALFRGTMQSGYVGEARVEDAGPPPALDLDAAVEEGRDRLAGRARALEAVVDAPARPAVPESLAGIACEYALFTHAPLFTYAGMAFPGMDPVREFVAADPDPECDVAMHDFATPLFSGMARRPDQEEWDRRLLFCPLAYWPALLRWVAAAVPVDRHGRVYHKVTPHVLRIVDRVAVERGGWRLMTGVPTVHVTVFGVSGTVHNVRFRPHVATPDQVARVDRLPLDPRVLREADRVLGRHPDPILAGDARGS